ncbi:MAG: type I restriction enzyme HsdR N-terminal domain-containing protein [Defluviicoccus sp.]|nr:type I restriction enzyme HsdR N-terminal domain-containing protein [Defluviicoccus sp.]
MTSLFSGAISTSALLQHKALAPLQAKALGVLDRIQTLEVTGFTEADVREEIISPLLFVLGYDKQSYFSIEREKSIQLPGRKNFLDYNLTLWSENFWLIEAKKPKTAGTKFSASDIRQAIGYAVHPEINAALMVLCDGRKIAVFDREESQIEPVLSVEITKLKENIDRLRTILSPWQVWFFEKRRIVRNLDKVFDKEFNMRRVEEFKELISRRLDSKRRIVIENMRSAVPPSKDTEETEEIIRSSGPIDLIEGAFFLQFTKRGVKTVAETLVKHVRAEEFQVLYRVFPDHARDMNDNYCMHALNLLIHLNEEKVRVNWLPSWLDKENDLEGAVKTLIANCLNHFDPDPVRRNILLCASGLRRMLKMMTVVDERLWSMGGVQHLIDRYLEPEDSWAQLLSSPERHNLLMLDGYANVAVARLVRECLDSHGLPQRRTLESRLREIWKVEAAILESEKSYQELLRERDMGEIFPTEGTDVVYDSLGHGVLCMMDGHETWKNYVLEHHRQDVVTLARIGSWQAKAWLGLDVESSCPRLSDQEMADRFFLGDVTMYRRLKTGYGYV